MAQYTGKTSLCSGQSLRMHASRGTTVAAIAGNIRLCGAPRWLADQVVSERIDVCEGSSHVIQDAGWITVTALSAAEVVWVAQHREAWLARLRLRLSEHWRYTQQLLSAGAKRS